MKKVRITNKSYVLLSISIVLVTITHLYFCIIHLINIQYEKRGTIIFSTKISLTFFINYEKQRQEVIESQSLKQIIDGKKYENELNFSDIDVIYTFVNGTDEEWLESKNLYYAEFLTSIIKLNRTKTKENIDKGLKKNNNENRYRDHDELRYSMRSVLKHAPWVNKVHLVISDKNQVPSWLNTSHPKINVVTHSDIFSNKTHLPTFNTNAIESQLDNIPGLADYYLYFNDDMMLGRNVTQYDFFITKSTGAQKQYDEGWSARSVCNIGCDYRYLKNERCDLACNVAACNFDYGDCSIYELERRKAKFKARLRKNAHSALSQAGFWDNAKYVDGVFNREFKVPPTKARNVIMHTPYLINKHMMKDLKQRFSDEFDWTASNKFRHPYDMQLSFSYFHYLDIVRVYSPTSTQAWHAAFLTVNHPKKIFLYDKLPLNWDEIEINRYGKISKSTDYQILKNCTHLFAKATSTNINITTYSNEHLLNKRQDSYYSASFCQQTMDKLLPKLRLPINDNKRLGKKYDVDFRMLYDVESFNKVQLQEVYFMRKKFITINDDMPSYQPKVEEAFKCMYEGLFPDPCVLELRTEPSSISRCKNMDEFKHYKPTIKDQAERARLMRIKKSILGWRLPTLNASQSALFNHDTFKMHSDPNEVASMVSGKYANLFKSRTRTHISPAGKN